MPKRKSIVQTIPGGWYGNDPGSLTDPKEGNVTVGSDYLDAALRWLLRRAKVLSITREGFEDGVSNLITYRVK